MKRVAIITAGGGNGHNAAAKALAETLAIQYPGYTVRIFDIADYLDSATRVGLLSSYSVIVQHLPKFWKFMYASAGTKVGHIISSEFIKMIALVSAKKLTAVLLKFSPDEIIGTHFFAPYFLAGTVLENVPMSMVVTDYCWHMFWYHPSVTRYFVGSASVKQLLVESESSIKPDNVSVTGIPVSPALYHMHNSIETKKRHNLPPDLPLILVLTGGSGNMDPTEFIPDLWNIPRISIIVITGRNSRLHEKISSLDWPQKVPYTILTWTKFMPRYLHAAAVVITKPGGLTTSECLAIEKPMVLVSPIPGQEEANIMYLTKIGAARFAQSPEMVVGEVKRFLRPLDSLRQSSGQAARGKPKKTPRPISSEVILAEIFKN